MNTLGRNSFVVTVLATALGLTSCGGKQAADDSTDDSASSATGEGESESESASGEAESESVSDSGSESESTGGPTPCNSLPCVSGDCVLDDGGAPTCACDTGWDGDLCDSCAPGHIPRSGYCMAPPNYAFVSKATFDGAQPGAKGQSGFEYGRDICNAEAGAAGLPGNYAPLWLAAGNTQPHVFFGGARGWVRPDLRIVADLLDEFMFAAVEAAPVLHADGSPASPAQHDSVWVGSSPALNSSAFPACDNWTSNDQAHYAGEARIFEPIEVQDWLVTTCDRALAVLCLGTDVMGQIPDPLDPSPDARVAFASGSLLVDAGIEAIDARCQADWLQYNPYDTRTFRAIVAAEGKSPIERVGLAEARWVRTDGVELAPDLESFINLDWGAFFDRNVNGSNMTARPIALGSSRLDEASSTANCQDWTSRELDSGAAIIGNSNRWPGTFGDETFECQQLSFVYFMCGEIRE